MAKEKYSKKKHLPLKISSNENWVEYNRKEVRRYSSLNSNWKKNFESLPVEEQQRLFFKYALDGNKKMLKFIAEVVGKVDIHFIDSDGNSALTFAAKSGKREAVEYLLKLGLDPNHINNVGISSLHLVVRKNALELARLLLGHGADIEIEDNYNQTVIFDAVQENNAEMIDFLEYAGADLNHKNKEGRTALMVASFNRHRQEALNKLIALGASVTERDNSGRDAFMHAINNNNGAMMDILIKAGADINGVDNEDITPLMICAKRGNREGIRVLIARGANVFAVNKYGQTAYDVAKKYGNSSSAEILAKAMKIASSELSVKEKTEALKEFAKHNRMENSCIR